MFAMMKPVLATSVLLLALCGCGFRYTPEDQLASMTPYQKTRIPVPPSDAIVPAKRLSPNRFLLTYSGFLIGCNGAKASPTVTLEKNGDHAELTFKWKEGDIESKVVNMDSGGAAPISEDGYFITANHVVTRDSHWISYWNEGFAQGSVSSSAVRIVYADKRMDFAIIKADFPTPRFLRIRPSAPKNDEVLFAGGSWLNTSCAAGRCKGVKRVFKQKSNDPVPFNMIATTIPVRDGDSGTPLIDAQGRLCGIMSRTVLGRWWKRREPETFAMMMERDTLLKIIEEDRTAHEPVYASLGTKDVLATWELIRGVMRQAMILVILDQPMRLSKKCIECREVEHDRQSHPMHSWLLNDASMAEDVVHDVFVRFAQSSRRFGLCGNLKSYLSTCVVNQARDRMRMQLRRTGTDLDAVVQIQTPDKGPVETVTGDELSCQAQAALLKLSCEQREAVVLHVKLDMPFKQIA